MKTFFNSKDLAVVIEHDEENPDEIHFRIKGDVQTRVELYESRRRDMIVDAYHREKNFAYEFSTKKFPIFPMQPCRKPLSEKLSICQKEQRHQRPSTVTPRFSNVNAPAKEARLS